MRKQIKKTALLVAPSLLLVAGLASYSSPTAFASGDATTPSPVTLTVYESGNQPTGWNRVVSTFEKETAKTLNINLNFHWIPLATYGEKVQLALSAGQPIDLDFDAPWLNLNNFIQNGDYIPLDQYFNNPAYPGLMKAFSPEVLKHNEFIGPDGKFHIYAVPLGQYYEDVGGIYYRKDWAQKFGIPGGNITTATQLYQYLNDIKKNMPSVIPYVFDGSQTNPNDVIGMAGDLSNQGKKMNSDGVYQVQFGNVGGMIYLKNNNVIASWLQGQPLSGLAKFPAPWNTQLIDAGDGATVQDYQLNEQWRKDGYLEANPITRSDSESQFTSGNAGTFTQTLSNYDSIYKSLKASVPQAKLGLFITNADVRTMKPHSMSTPYQDWNFLAIPRNSPNLKRTMQFLNWLFLNKKNNYLLQYGVEGQDWVPVGSDQFAIPKGVKPANVYNMNGYLLSWNPNYVMQPAEVPSSLLKYDNYLAKDSTYFLNPVGAFSMNTSSVQVQEKAPDVTALKNWSQAEQSGIVSDPVASLKQKLAQYAKNSTLQSDLASIQKAGVAQLQKYLNINH